MAAAAVAAADTPKQMKEAPLTATVTTYAKRKPQGATNTLT
jgi:hypothetical protein